MKKKNTREFPSVKNLSIKNQIKDKGGRPPKEVNFKIFEGLCKIMCTEEEICSIVGVCADTLNVKLKEHYGEGFSEIYKKFSAFGKASLRRVQFRLARTKPGMAIWLGKQYLGQKDRMEVSLEEAYKDDLDFMQEEKPISRNRISEILN